MLLDERVSAWIGLSLGLVVAGIVIVNRSGQAGNQKRIVKKGVERSL
ncbi:hypothetical protein VQ056_16305 [Paenibacillus sp. JTLBN-2024]